MSQCAKSGLSFELYKLHAGLADRVSVRREGANRLFAGLMTAYAASVGAVLNLSPGSGLHACTLMIGGGVGLTLAICWIVTIISYQRLNSAKYDLLQEIEDKLGIDFFRREWEILGRGKEPRRYFKLTWAEGLLAIVFVMLSVGMCVVGFLSR